MIRHQCPCCGEKLTFRDAAAGMEVSCVVCRVRLTVPSGKSATPDELPRLAAPALDSATALAVALARAQGYLPPLQRSQPREGAKSRKLWLMMAGIPLLTALSAWLLAGNVIWLLAGMLVLFAVVGMILGLGSRFLKQGIRPEGPELLTVGYLGLVLGIWFGVGWLFQVATVHIDNFSRNALRVQVDGRDFLTATPGSMTVKTLSRGSHRITVLDAEGRQLNDFPVQTEGNAVYVLNLFRAQKYQRGSVEYGGFAFGDTSSVKEINELWFEPKVDYLFEEPPQSITVTRRRGQTYGGTTRTYLKRGPAPKAKTSY